MKAIKYLMLIAVSAVTLSSCMVQERGRLYVRGHYEIGTHGSRHWVPSHYERR